MDKAIHHRENRSRGLFYREENGEKISELTYTIQDAGIIVIDHTETKMGYEHQGYASELLDYVVNWAREKNIKIEPLCPFAEIKFDENPDYADVRA
ncbi:GNAT family N-acetyltransferase [Leeuwenhoekiella parthenopeia]|uniref:N-acetyltransferase n=1 Tax=Leeuwenhoekiella parthenopeia TaxID=2890320 RepID=A0ABS8GX99_9FLAO|nr:GNAT family N-acetyltransferase [Leeuwenhoekiella parthenopeia]MCC4214270.1 N-acetyltransferase [Leeuwenhoekiella parthenopeia]